MAEINLSKYGISGTTEIVRNPSFEALFEEEMKPGLEGYAQRALQQETFRDGYVLRHQQGYPHGDPLYR